MTRKSMQQWVGAGVVLMLGSLVVVSAENTWGNYHWESAGPPDLVVRANFKGSTEWMYEMDLAVADWNDSVVKLTALDDGGTNPRRCKATDGRIEVCADEYGFNGWAGLAQIWISGGHITKAIAKMNDSYLYLGGPYTSWRQYVMCQELGHDLGLAHQEPGIGSCMGSTVSDEPNTHDLDQLAIIYGHSHDAVTEEPPPPGGGRGGGRGGGGGVNLPPPAMGEIDFESPAQWGRLVSTTADGRGQTYELDFGGGFRLATHVYWADPTRAPRP